MHEPFPACWHPPINEKSTFNGMEEKKRVKTPTRFEKTSQSCTFPKRKKLDKQTLKKHTEAAPAQ
jgi:hypothetical protein